VILEDNDENEDDFELNNKEGTATALSEWYSSRSPFCSPECDVNQRQDYDLQNAVTRFPQQRNNEYTRNDLLATHCRRQLYPAGKLVFLLSHRR
jgi:hypothetical protein